MGFLRTLKVSLFIRAIKMVPKLNQNSGLQTQDSTLMLNHNIWGIVCKGKVSIKQHSQMEVFVQHSLTVFNLILATNII